jgi:hypothetical protein
MENQNLYNMDATYTFDQLPGLVAEMSRKIDRLAAQLKQGQESEEDKLMSLTQLQDHLEKETGKRYASQTIYMWVNDRSIPKVKHGKYLYFRRSEIDAWLANGRKI